MKNPREVALKGLMNLRRNGTWPDLYIKQECGDMSPQDGALAAGILYTTLENQYLIDFYIGHFSSIKIKKVMPQVLDILRTAVCQMVFFDKIPHSAAVNEAVKLTKKYAPQSAVGYVNAMLRAVSKNKGSLPRPSDSNAIEYLSIMYTHPLWFVEEMVHLLGSEGAEKLLCANNSNPRVCARVNTLKTTTVQLIAQLAQEGFEAEKLEELPNAIIFKQGFNPAICKAFKDGLFYIQDGASQLCVMALDPQKNSVLMDMCASPGGKTLMAAQLMDNTGEITAFDLHEHKIRLVQDNAVKYGVSVVKALQGDSTIYQEKYKESADYIICDVVCSGMGIIRKKPDIRFKTKEEIKDLPKIQYDILKTSARYLKKGGTLVYSTCTVRTQENQDVINRFIRENKEYELISFELPYKIKGEGGYTTLYPHIEGFDGFFIAKLRKKI